MSVTPAVSYLPTGLAGCSVGPGISCGARKLTRTPRVTKKKKKTQLVNKDFWIFMVLSFESFLFQKEMKNIFGKILKSILKAIWKSKVKN
jgi:hypothetical protein